MSSGIAYFKDGHTEVITSHKTYGFSGFVEFYTESGKYYYEAEIFKVSGSYSAVRHRFYKIDPNDADKTIVVPIDKIVLI